MYLPPRMDTNRVISTTAAEKERRGGRTCRSGARTRRLNHDAVPPLCEMCNMKKVSLQSITVLDRLPANRTTSRNPRRNATINVFLYAPLKFNVTKEYLDQCRGSMRSTSLCRSRHPSKKVVHFFS